MDDQTAADLSKLPLDPDLERATAAERTQPVHLTWRFLGVVAAGGAMGTAIREALSLVIPPFGGIAWVILAINVVGAFCLGLLLEALVRRGSDDGRRRITRLFAGTGVLGGFTTYSTLATAAASLFAAGQPWLALAYAVGTVALGAAATAAGIACASASHARTTLRQSKRQAIAE